MNLEKFHINVSAIDPWEILRPIIENHFGDIEQLNRDQLSRGERADGSAMPDYKSEVYADFKDKYIPTYSIYPTTDLRYTGSFYKALKASFSSYGISIESFDSKAKKLEYKYGSSIYGLSEKSLIIFADKIRDEFISALRFAMFSH